MSTQKPLTERLEDAFGARINESTCPLTKFSRWTHIEVPMTQGDVDGPRGEAFYSTIEAYMAEKGYHLIRDNSNERAWGDDQAREILNLINKTSLDYGKLYMTYLHSNPDEKRR